MRSQKESCVNLASISSRRAKEPIGSIIATCTTVLIAALSIAETIVSESRRRNEHGKTYHIRYPASRITQSDDEKKMEHWDNILEWLRQEAK